MKNLKKLTIIFAAITLFAACKAAFDKRILYDASGNAYQLRKGQWELSGYQYHVDSLGKIGK